LFALGVNFFSQVLIVRYLSKGDYGAFEYALSIVALGETVATVGLDRAITRFLPIYHEHRDYNKLFGTLLLVTGTILSCGLAMTLFVWAFQGFIAERLINDRQVVSLLLILILLSPVQALDGLIIAMFAVFARARSIFFRKYVLAPGLKLAVVLLLLLAKSSVFFLAAGYLAASVIGVIAYATVLARELRKQGLLEHATLRKISFPARQVFVFTIPLLTTDLMHVLMNALNAGLLEHFYGSAEVATFRVVQPAARLNQMVLASFSLLFTPLASRLFARNDQKGINNLYWQTAIWIAVISFPIFALTFSLSRPLTLLLYGPRYEESALILALLSFAYYLDAALGPNGLALAALGKVRFVVVANLLAIIVSLALSLLLIPRYGALGAAIGISATVIARNIVLQAALQFSASINSFELRYLNVYIVVALSGLGLLMFQLLTSFPPFISFALAALASAIVVGVNRKSLDIEQTFPEMLRFPLVRHFFR
jgi:O-antigen/teichoic acid export membrane protein